MKKYLFVLRRFPHNGNHVQEILDMLLTTAAFDQQVSVLFADDGVLQLKNGQNPSLIGCNDTAAVFQALEIYDVNALYAEVESLQARGLAVEDLSLPVQPVSRGEIQPLMEQHQVLIPD